MKKDSIISEVVSKDFASQGFRTIMTTYADLPIEQWNKLKAAHNDLKTLEDKLGLKLADLTLVSIFAIVDPVKPGIKEAINQCKLSGINVRMVTGDHLDTAIAISK